MNDNDSEPEPFVQEDNGLPRDLMRRKLQFFFMDPFQKYRVRRRFPYKLVIQLFKIFFVTLQVCLFAYHRHAHANFTWNNKIAFSHLFLKNWDPVREIDAYPPAMGPMAIYEKEEFFDTIDHAYGKFVNLSNAVGSYSYVNGPDMELCLSVKSKSAIFEGELVETCHNISQEESRGYTSRQFLKEDEINFAKLIKAWLKFSVKTVNYQANGEIRPPNCYRFDINIIFDNDDLDGQILVSLEARPVQITCDKDIQSLTFDVLASVMRCILNYFIILICIASCILCSRALWKAHRLKILTNKFFVKHFQQPLSSNDNFKFVNWWYIMIIINDVLIIIGSVIKDQIEHKTFKSEEWDACSFFLGMGNMLVWFGVLRYLGFFKTYNIVILTFGKAAPEIVKFLVCALLIFLGFTFSGWLILGPYHLKFRSLSTTAECLFSLINGDDMFATFSIMSSESLFLWVFSKVYFYIFISLYIYIILSTFISVIDDAYDTIRKYYNEGFPKSDLQKFMEESSSCEDLRDQDTSISGCMGVLLDDLCCMCQRRLKERSRESLLSDN